MTSSQLAAGHYVFGWSLYKNKNAFQLKAHLPLANRKLKTYNLTLEWPWPWCNLNLIDDLDLRQVKLMSRCQINIFHEMTLTLTQWPWPNLWPWPETSQTELNWCSGSQISIFHEMTLTLILKLDLDIVKMYHHTKNEVSMSTGSKVIAWTDTHTDMMKTLPLPHMWEVIMTSCMTGENQ